MKKTPEEKAERVEKLPHAKELVIFHLESLKPRATVLEWEMIRVAILAIKGAR